MKGDIYIIVPYIILPFGTNAKIALAMRREISKRKIVFHAKISLHITPWVRDGWPDRPAFKIRDHAQKRPIILASKKHFP